MRLIALLTFAVHFLLCQASGQSPKKLELNLGEHLMPIGVYYYPEAWPKNQWDRDLGNIEKMGFKFTHFAEFAWANMEPQEGKFNFGWLDTAIVLAAKHNLKVILCTPTATPPAWMATNYPEILIVNNQGRTIRHGTRMHASWSSEKYKFFSKRIIAELGKRYGQNATVAGWQLDNEPSHYGVESDYGPEARKHFISWLKKKYKGLPALNNAWGASFWSQSYTTLDQIRIPNEKELVHGYNPHQLLDFKRFTADECAEFLTLSKNTLRNVVSPKQWITSNFMGTHTNTDPNRSANLDVVSYTTYPVAGYTSGLGEQGFRIGSPYLLPYLNDFFRSLNGHTGVMELQPGQVNWGRLNPQPFPGVVRAWLYAAYAGGCEFACSYRFRQPRYGSEMYHYGMVGTDGVTPLPGGLEYSRTIHELDSLKAFASSQSAPQEWLARKVGILYNVENIWDLDIQKQTYQWNTQAHIAKYYNALKQLKCPVDFVTETADFSQYPLLIAPAYQLVDSQLVNKWTRYVENGGNLILTSRTATKDKRGHLWESNYQGPITKLIGAEIDFFDLLPESVIGKISYQGKEYTWNNWADILKPAPGTLIEATYQNQFYASKPAITSRKFGKGSVTYMGVETETGELEKDYLKSYLKSKNLNVSELPEGVYVQWRDGFWIACNFNSEEKTLTLPLGAKILTGSPTLPPAGVCIWKEN